MMSDFNEAVVNILVACGEARFTRTGRALDVLVTFHQPSSVRGIQVNVGEMLVELSGADLAGTRLGTEELVCVVADELVCTLRHGAHDATRADYREAARRLLLDHVDELGRWRAAFTNERAVDALMGADSHWADPPPVRRRPPTQAYRRADGRPLNG